MQKMLKHIFPDEFFKNPAFFRAFILGMMYVGLVVTQLFTFEKFTDVVAGFGLPGGRITAVIVAVAVPLVEIIALPYLISMKLSGRVRAITRVATVVAPSLWLVLALWMNVFPESSRLNSGLFGATIPTVVGIWVILFAALWLWAAVLVMRELPPRDK